MAEHDNGTQTRIDFINPFLKALGWDIDSEANPNRYPALTYDIEIIINNQDRIPVRCSILGQEDQGPRKDPGFPS